MAYLKPNWFQRRIFNPIAMRFGIGDATTLVTTGRRSGNESRVPVIVLEHEGGRYLVSTRGDAAWVHNLRAASGGRLERKDVSEVIAVSELPVEERDAILAAYQKKAGRVVKSYFSALPDAADHPVFVIQH